MFQRNALKLGVVAATVLGIALTACNSKDDNPTPAPPRSATYKLRGTGTDATRQTGAVTITENSDSSVNVILTLGKHVKDTLHQVYFISGNYATPTTDTLQSAEAKGTGGSSVVTVELFKNVKTIKLRQAAGASKDIAFKYNDATKLLAHIKVKHSKFSADTLAIGNFGKEN
ncbi:hypothetical protein [Chitinophaga qingshengii]|uniref:Uncharacterized protein n=1 Tax=Chitinophaga qingshengii TaxID=1569794 RepID=A0ABR7TN94_9BACT|nr:hypothetical protein [Chitinophaga qingshengii]MBC9931455.1 hypothetical protein [Chitinophaga qingshengii]